MARTGLRVYYHGHDANTTQRPTVRRGSDTCVSSILSKQSASPNALKVRCGLGLLNSTRTNTITDKHKTTLSHWQSGTVRLPVPTICCRHRRRNALANHLQPIDPLDPCVLSGFHALDSPTLWLGARSAADTPSCLTSQTQQYPFSSSTPPFASDMVSTSLFFSPNAPCYAVIRMDPVAMVKKLDDPEALAAARAMTPRSYVVYLIHVTRNPPPMSRMSF